MKAKLPFSMRVQRAILWLVTLAMGVLCMWHVNRYVVVEASWHMVHAALFAAVFVAMFWAGLSSRRQITSGAVTIAQDYRAGGEQAAERYVRAYHAERLSMKEVETSGATLWAVDLATETIASSHGRSGLSNWGFEPDETVDTPLSDYSIDEWDLILPSLLSAPGVPIVVVGEDYVSTFAASPPDDPDRVVVTTISTGQALRIGGVYGRLTT